MNNNNNNKRLKLKNNNNNNKIKRIVILPIYLQKFILKLLINEITRKDEKLDYYKSISFEKQFKCKLLNLSLTCWEWFKTISNNLYIANDDNQIITTTIPPSISKYSLIKFENIKVLKLTKPFSIEYCLEINKILKKLINLKKLILSSTFTSCSGSDNNWLLFHKYILNINLYKIDINCDINDIYEYNNEYGLITASINSTIGYDDGSSSSGGGGSSATTTSKLNISYLNIWSDFDEIECELIALDYIKYFKPNKLFLYPTTNIIKFSKGNELFNNNNNNNNQACSLSFKELYYYEPITIKELFNILKYSNKIKNLSFQICFDTLIYYLSSKEDGVEGSSRGLPKCKCNTFNEEDEEDGDGNFYYYWNFIFEKIQNHKFLKFLSITNRCPSSFELNQFYTGNYQLDSKWIDNIEFIENNFGKMLLNNKSISTLKLNGFHTPKLFEYLINGGNKSIIKYKSEYIDTLNLSKHYINTINNLLKNNPSIIKFHLHEINFKGDYLKKNYLTFKNFYNNKK